MPTSRTSAGSFAGPDRRLAFGVDDFDETLPGPFEWDVKRLVASFEVAGHDRGFGAQQRTSIDRAVARSYRVAMRGFAELRALELWYIQIDRDLEDIVKEWSSRLGRDQLKHFERNLAKAPAKDSLSAFAKLTRLVEGRPRIIHDPPLIVPIEEQAQADDPAGLEAAVHGVMRYYRRTLPRDRRRLLERSHYIHAARRSWASEALALGPGLF